MVACLLVMRSIDCPHASCHFSDKPATGNMPSACVKVATLSLIEAIAVTCAGRSGMLAQHSYKDLHCVTGVICNNIIPQWLRVVTLVALLLVVVYKTAKKGLRCEILSLLHFGGQFDGVSVLAAVCSTCSLHRISGVTVTYTCHILPAQHHKRKKIP